MRQASRSLRTAARLKLSLRSSMTSLWMEKRWTILMMKIGKTMSMTKTMTTMEMSTVKLAIQTVTSLPKRATL